MTHSTGPMPPMEGLQALLAAARNGSFNAAASELGLTHGSVSRRIQHVELWLGTQLFERYGRGVKLTPAGTRLVRHVEEAFGHIAMAAEPWRSPRGPQAVRISVLPSFAKLWLLPRIADLQGHPEDLRLELLIQYELADFANDRIDFAIRHGSGPWPTLNATRLFGERLVPAAAPALASKLGEDASIDAILAHPLIHNADGSDWRVWFGEAKMRFRPRAIDHRFEDYDIALAAAEAGLGVILLRRPFANNWLLPGKLMPVSRVEAENPKAHYIVTAKNNPISPAATLCMDRLLKATGKNL